ncbi:hypothetical protein GCM10018790_47200 [Kitasatospora xanthocidica]|uniref:hypothetical protein n=1 Tax=Kitasatospora xanthocidica TaxID=83382 RepID=UPI00167404B5|nr:hypothetical protein [Kitasatospora xanthocidica]GHF63838.1 hypothetical protein GCM10018790_47200 [Kitasatospora xanthocidica]
MAFTDGTPGTGTGTNTGTPAAPDYSPAAWPEPVELRPRPALDPLGTVLIPAPERQLFTRGPGLPEAHPAPAAPAPVAWPPPVHRAPTVPRTTTLHARRLPLPGGGTRHRHLLDRIRVPLRACHRIAVLGSPAEGLTTVLGALLAEHRADQVLVLLPGSPPPAAGHGTGGRLVVHAVPPDPASFPGTLTELSGHYPVILTDTTTSPVDLRPPAVGLADQLVLCEPATPTGARNADALLAHLTALGHHGLVHGAATVFTPAPPTDHPLAARDLLPHFRARCRGAVLLPPHTPADPATLRPRTRTGYLELAALIGDAIADRHP